MSAPSPSAAPPGGLSSAEAAARLAADGPNRIDAKQRNPLLQRGLEVAGEPMFLLLLAAGAVYLLIGDTREALLLLGFVLVIIALTVLQTRRTEKVLDALRELSAPRARVLRDGAVQSLGADQVVAGDVLLVAEGERIVADGEVLAANELSVDESLLTGESVPVHKSPAAVEPGGRVLYAGTLVTQGQGQLRVTATGSRTELGRIGRTLDELHDAPSPLQVETRRFVRRFAIGGLGLCAALVLLYGLERGDWLNGLLAGITLAMGILPQEFPVILTVFTALGARRIAQQRVLARRLGAIETLGQTSVLCVDKTGTLTRNQMSVRALMVDDTVFEVDDHTRVLPEACHLLLEYGILASEIEPFDPMEQAFHRLGRASLADTEHLHPDWILSREYELSPDLLAMSHLWQQTEGHDGLIASKGAPEAIAELCRLPPPARARLLERAAGLAARGLRVLAVARASAAAPWPERQHDFDFELLGLIALADPVRPEVPAAVAECRAAGVRVVMITGDYPATARAIARDAGIAADEVLSGAELDRLDESQLRERVRHVSVFARIAPLQKLRLIDAFKANGEVVAMTGDGVNDAPALKSAHIGIAMGRRGAEVAREAADLVLLDDDFTAVVAAMRQGRLIYDNLLRAVRYTLAVHLPLLGLALAPVLFGWPLILLPAHVVFLELVIDPVCSIVFEAEPAPRGLMRRPPRPPEGTLFQRETFRLSLLQGGAVLLAALLAYRLATAHAGAEAARTVAFVVLVVGNLGLALCNRHAWRAPNPWLGWVGAATLLLLGLVVLVPDAAALFGFAALDGELLLGGAAAAVAACALAMLAQAALRRAGA